MVHVQTQTVHDHLTVCWEKCVDLIQGVLSSWSGFNAFGDQCMLQINDDQIYPRVLFKL